MNPVNAMMCCTVVDLECQGPHDWGGGFYGFLKVLPTTNDNQAVSKQGICLACVCAPSNSIARYFEHTGFTFVTVGF